MTLQHDFAMSFFHRLREAVRERLLDHATLMMAGNCQTSQAMGLFYGVYESGEKAQAFARLLELIEEENGHMDTGVLGARVLFHVLSDFGRSDLALSMIARPDFPSYGNWVTRGATSLWEDFQPEGGNVASLNHHFWGDISGWFIQCLAGIRFNPYRHNIREVNIRPSFVEALDFAEGFHIAPSGKIESKWKRDETGIVLTISVPEAMSGCILLESGYVFEDGLATKPAVTGEYRVVKRL
jgi:alpha-L-rhamnosidase